MALSTTITKKSVTFSGEGKYDITINLSYKDDTTVLIDKDFTAVWKPTIAWADVYKELLVQMKAEIRRYKECQNITNSAGYTNVITNLNKNVGV